MILILLNFYILYHLILSYRVKEQYCIECVSCRVALDVDGNTVLGGSLCDSLCIPDV